MFLIMTAYNSDSVDSENQPLQWSFLYAASFGKGVFLGFVTYNWWQNESRHFALNWFFYVLLTSKGGNIAFSPPFPPCSVVPMFELPIENNKHPNFEWRGQGMGADSFVLWSYPISVECLNNFVVDCLNCKSGHTSLKKLIQLISSCWDVRPLVAFYLQFDFIMPILEQ